MSNNTKIVNSNPINISISGLLYQIEIKKYILKPEFQRKYVWKKNRVKDDLMKSIFLGYPIGVLTAWEDGNGQFNVVDGLQRLTTIKSFYEKNEKYPRIGKEISKKIIEAHLNLIKIVSEKGDSNAKNILKKLEKKETMLLTFKRLPKFLKELFKNFQITISNISNANAKQIRNYFSVLQNQEKLRAGEIIHSITDNHLVKIIESSSIENALSNISFNNNRSDFTKFIIMFHGIKYSNLKMGQPDVVYSKYANKIDEHSEFNDILYAFINDLNKNEKIFLENYSDRSFNKFSLKLLLGIVFLKNKFYRTIYLPDLIQFLYWLSDKISKINSINRKQLIDEEIRNKVKIISLLGRTTHGIDKIKKTLEIVISIFKEKNISEIRERFFVDNNKTLNSNIIGVNKDKMI